MNEQDARRYYEQWRNSTYSTQRVNRTNAERAATKLYEQVGEERPWFIFVEGPYQMTILPTVFAAVLRSNTWSDLSRQFRTEVYPEDDWEPFWQQLWTELIERLFNDHALILQHLKVQEFVRERAVACLKRELYRRVRAEARSSDNVIERLRKQHGAERLLSRQIRAHLRVRREELRTHLQFTLRKGLALHYKEGAWPRTFNRIEDVSRRLAMSMTTNLLWQAGDLSDEPLAATWIVWENPWLAEAHTFADMPSYSELRQRAAEDTLEWLEFAKIGFAARFDDVVCTLCDRPTAMRIDENDLLHNVDGPAIQFNDGFVGYQARGMFIEPEYILEPGKLRADAIGNANNVEVRRALLDIYGEARYLQDTDAELVHEDQYGKLYCKRFSGDEPLLMVRVKNSTPEPDGTWRHYFLRVPPNIRTAKEAVAWTFALEQDQYTPEAET